MDSVHRDREGSLSFRASVGKDGKGGRKKLHVRFPPSRCGWENSRKKVVQPNQTNSRGVLIRGEQKEHEEGRAVP